MATHRPSHPLPPSATMNNGNGQKRKPLGQTPSDISNRLANKSSIEHPVKTTVKNGHSRPSLPSGPKAPVNVDVDDESRARVYKAQAYEAKITIASQTQRIESLQAELEEVKFFAEEERKQKAVNYGNISCDAELIEALARELEGAESDLRAAKSREERLKRELTMKRDKKTPPEIQMQAAELEKMKNDAAEGVAIMRELEGALRLTRSERDATRSERDGANARVESLRAELESVRAKGNELERTSAELQKMVDLVQSKYATLEKNHSELQNQLGVIQSRSDSNVTQMKEALEQAEGREKKTSFEYHGLMARYREGEEQLQFISQALSDLTEQLEAQKGEIAIKDQALKEMDEVYASSISTIKQNHVFELEKLKGLCTEDAGLFETKLNEVEKKNEQAIQELKNLHAEELLSKDRLLKQTQKTSHEEIESLKENLVELERLVGDASSATIEKDSYVSYLKIENAKLKTEKEELMSNIERGVAMYNETTAQLKSKTLELNNLKMSSDFDVNKIASTLRELETKLTHKDNELKQLHSRLAAEAEMCPNRSTADADLASTNNDLKRDLASAVESSISRGKEILALKNEIALYQAKIVKLNQKNKRMASQATTSNCTIVPFDEDKHQLESEITRLRNNAEEDKQRLELEIGGLRLHASEAEKTITDLKEQISNSTTTESQIQTLQSDLTNTRKALARSQSRITKLEEALKDAERALRAVSNNRMKASSSFGNDKDAMTETRENEEVRTQIENAALKEYVDQRL